MRSLNLAELTDYSGYEVLILTLPTPPLLILGNVYLWYLLLRPS